MLSLFSWKRHPIFWTLFWFGVVAAIYTSPDGAAVIAQHVLGAIGTAIRAFASFIGHVAGAAA